MIDKEKITKLLDDVVKPALQSHGGDLELVEITDDGVVKVVLEGACKGCPMAQMTIREGVQKTLQEEVPEVKEVVAVEAAEGDE